MAIRKTNPGSVTIRHYCQGIGDCHLLSFPKDDGTKVRILIDCGVHLSISGGPALIDEIVADIASETQNHIDLLVVTHEHWDHNSGFWTANAAFKAITIDEVWMAWTEDPADAQARELDKFKAKALSLLLATQQQLTSLLKVNALSDHMAGLCGGLGALLQFYGAAAHGTVRDAREAAKALAGKGGVKYLEPKDPPLTIAGLGNLRIYVLGPPRDKALIDITERSSEMYALGGRESAPIIKALADALDGSNAPDDSADASPFDWNLGWSLDAAMDEAGNETDCRKDIRDFIRQRYIGTAHADTDPSWRRIDHDWLGVSADLALQLDEKTNNTSLVLAFEFIDTGRVLLFAADAQVGNWLSWQDVSWGDGKAKVTGPDLLERTVYYKVGHHGSQNATLKAKGLELMTSHDLSAFIPTNRDDAVKVRWGRMPYDGILTDLEQRTAGRVVRADDPWAATVAGKPSFATPSGSVRTVGSKPSKDPKPSDGSKRALWVELEVE